MKIFFAATIGFQVPVKSFGDAVIIGRGCLFVLALLGKLLVGGLAPNFHAATPRYRGRHLRDCFIVGLSMMGEAEFAFVVAVFGVTEGLIPPDLYASIVLAILLSTLISPLLLRTTLSLYPYEKVMAPSEKDGDSVEVVVWQIRVVHEVVSLSVVARVQKVMVQADFVVLSQETWSDQDNSGVLFHVVSAVNQNEYSFSKLLEEALQSANLEFTMTKVNSLDDRGFSTLLLRPTEHDC